MSKRWVTTKSRYRVKSLSSNTCTAGHILVARVRSSNPKSPNKNFPLSSRSSPPPPIGLGHTPTTSGNNLSLFNSFSSYPSSLSREKNWNTFYLLRSWNWENLFISVSLVWSVGEKERTCLCIFVWLFLYNLGKYPTWTSTSVCFFFLFLFFPSKTLLHVLCSDYCLCLFVEQFCNN